MSKITIEQIKILMDKKHKFMEEYRTIGKLLDEIIGHTDHDCIAWFHCHCENGNKIWKILKAIDRKREGKGKKP